MLPRGLFSPRNPAYLVSVCLSVCLSASGCVWWEGGPLSRMLACSPTCLGPALPSLVCLWRFVRVVCGVLPSLAPLVRKGLWAILGDWPCLLLLCLCVSVCLCVCLPRGLCGGGGGGVGPARACLLACLPGLLCLRLSASGRWCVWCVRPLPSLAPSVLKGL